MQRQMSGLDKRAGLRHFGLPIKGNYGHKHIGDTRLYKYKCEHAVRMATWHFGLKSIKSGRKHTKEYVKMAHFGLSPDLRLGPPSKKLLSKKKRYDIAISLAIRHFCLPARQYGYRYKRRLKGGDRYNEYLKYWMLKKRAKGHSHLSPERCSRQDKSGKAVEQLLSDYGKNAECREWILNHGTELESAFMSNDLILFGAVELRAEEDTDQWN